MSGETPKRRYELVRMLRSGRGLMACGLLRGEHRDKRWWRVFVVASSNAKSLKGQYQHGIGIVDHQEQLVYWPDGQVTDYEGGPVMKGRHQ